MVILGPGEGAEDGWLNPGWEISQSLCWILQVNVLDSILDLCDLLPLYVQVGLVIGAPSPGYFC